MSILIKGMEMPRHCGECGIEWCDRWKRLVVAGMAIAKERPSDCPLVPVPPHGDLIDRKPFVEFIKTYWDSYDQWFVEQLEARPTIIPADPAEEDKL